MSRYLVTGATGFLGTHLVAHLRDKGHDVVALVRGDADDLAERGVVIAKGDVLDPHAVNAAAAGCDGVFHCAGKVSRKAEDAEELHRTNVEGTKIVVSASKAAGVKRLVLASTSGTVAISKEPKVRDERAKTPIELIAKWPYYRSKLYAEQAALEASAEGFAVVSVNPSLLLGPGDLRGSSTGDVRSFLEGEVPVIPAGGMSFVDARDVAPVMLAAMERGKPGARYLVSGANMEMSAFFGRLSRISGVELPAMRAPKGLTLAKIGASLFDHAKKVLPVKGEMDSVSAEMGQVFWYCDSRKATEELGFAPRDPNETLADTIADLYDRGVVWPVAPRKSLAVGGEARATSGE
ncbi:MAG: NAD-dependent epimerase/dehydratase family protein [Polyangiaceae bacterium]